MIIRSLYSRNFVYVFQADCAGDIVTRLSRTLLYASCFFEEVCGGGRFGDKGERAVGLDGDDSWNRDTRFDVCRSRIELPTKINRFHAPSSECRPDWGCRRGLASLHQNALSILHVQSDPNATRVWHAADSPRAGP